MVKNNLDFFSKWHKKILKAYIKKMRHASLQNTCKNPCKNFDTFSNYIK